MVKLFITDDMGGKEPEPADYGAKTAQVQANVTADKELIKDIKSLDTDVGKRFEERMDELVLYAALAENYHDIHDEYARVRLFSKLSYGLRRAGEGYAWALLQHKKSIILKKETEASASSDELANYISKQKELDPKFRVTENTKKQFIYTVDAVRGAARLEAVCEAMAENFAIMRTEFLQALSTLRAMCYGSRDSIQMSSAASSEGMVGFNENK